MKNLVIGSLAAIALSQAAGCIFVTDNSNNNALLSTHWELENLVGSVITTCPTGFGTAAVISQPVDSLNRPIGGAFTDYFNCEDHAGTVELPPGPYQISISIETNSGGTQYAESLAEIIDLTFNDGNYDTTIFNDAGYLSMGWNFVGANTNAPLDCSSFLSDGVQSVATTITTPVTAFSDKFNCTDFAGTTDPLGAATYDVDIQAFRGQTVIGSAPTMNNVIVDNQNAVTDLGTVTIRMNGL